MHRRKPLKRSGPPKRVNVKRRQSERERTYGPAARRAFVRRQPCSACGMQGYSQNAHVHKMDAGAGRRGSYKGIAALCGPRMGVGIGCHQLFDVHRDKFDARFPWYVPEFQAAELEAQWVEFSEGEEW